jgi:tellurite resistance protein TerC
MLFTFFRITYVLARRLVILLLGSTLVLIGVAMIVLPGPAVLVIPLGLAVLGMEFAWARHWLHKIQEETNERLNKLLKTGNHHLHKLRRRKSA